MRVLYFAAVRRSIGTGEELLDLPEDVKTAGELLAWLRGRDELHEAGLSGRVCIAVNQEHVDESTRLDGVEEVAFFPPVTGG
ncbi:MAG: molybdopterin converting factor subunit 1 [Hyphomicrobiales bacterium]|nr:molybdopterin converting factor subunit 1 [Hyphomicrobiales bacterium]MCY4033575.1 molybdopterin converting factor subunit 1 [Hyphomicrobiales bacterium]MCY4039325.1 molybdopterin converting factor subunit 1 [Hyphomicrobiales bacterium]